MQYRVILRLLLPIHDHRISCTLKRIRFKKASAVSTNKFALATRGAQKHWRWPDAKKGPKLTVSWQCSPQFGSAPSGKMVLTAICTISFLCQQMENSCKEDFEPNIVKHEENSLSTTISRHGEFVTPVCTVCTIRIEDSHKSQIPGL